MKKFNLIVLIIFVLLSSCTKDKDEMLAKEKDTGYKMYLSVDPTETLILDFINKMDLVREYPNYEGSEEWNYSKDSAVWYIEAVLNYKYSYVWQYLGNEEHSDFYNIDSSYSTVEANDEGDFNIVDLQTSYDNLASDLENQYSGVEAESKFFVLSDIMDLGTGNGDLNLMQYSVVGMANQATLTGDWKWGLKGGDCSGNYIGQKDATDVIEQKLSYYRVGSEGLVYLNITHAQTPNNGWIIPDDVPLLSGQTNPTPFHDYQIFCYTDQWGHPCLSDSDMDWYKGNILNIESSYQPTYKSIIYTDVESALTPSMPYSLIIHIIYSTYGEAHIFQYPDPMD